MLMTKDREILDLKATITEYLAVGSGNGLNSIMTSLGMGSVGSGVAGGGVGSVGAIGMSAAPGGFPASTRASASTGLFTPYSHHAGENGGGELGVLDLPAGTELSKLAGLGLDNMDSNAAVTRSEAACWSVGWVTFIGCKY